MDSAEDQANPNLEDLPGETEQRAFSRVARDDDDQQVMGAQSARASSSAMVNGTYGSVGPMMTDGEVRQPMLSSGSGRRGASADAGRVEAPAVSMLRAAAGKVMATVAAKVQGVTPPSSKAGSAATFLGQDDSGSVGTMGSGYVTAGSEPLREQQSASGAPDAGDSGLFSPQQARRLREMQDEAPLLFPGEESVVQHHSPPPQIPHSASSGSDQAEAIQAEVKRQMQSFMVVQAELQQRVAVLVEENQVLRQVASTSSVGSEGQGSQSGKGGWFSGIRRNLMGFVQQVSVKSASVPLAIPEGWALPSGAFASPPPHSGTTFVAGTSQESVLQHGATQAATPIVPSAGQPQPPYGLGNPSAAQMNVENQGFPKQPWQPLHLFKVGNVSRV